MFVVVSYDIPEDKRRLKVAKELENYGNRVQYSVFECNLQEDKLKEMCETLLSIIKQQEDSLRVYRLCESCLKKVKIYGTGEISKDEDFYIV
jgi:CRISPR-associated protein Cas2